MTEETHDDASDLEEASSDPEEDSSTNDEPDLPESVVETAERLTRRARAAVDDGEARAYRADRDARLAAYDYTARVRDDPGDAGETLVLHPDAWVADGVVRPGRVDDVDRAVEISLSGPDDPGDWAAVDDHNRELVARVRVAHGDAHAAVVDALADYAGNHYAKPIEDLTASELRRFREDYVTRNAWLTDEQREALEASVRYAFDAADARLPEW